jgi:hypothetical protein
VEVGSRSKAVLGSLEGHGKSPCFSGYGVLTVGHLDQKGLFLLSVDIGVLLECAC